MRVVGSEVVEEPFSLSRIKDGRSQLGKFRAGDGLAAIGLQRQAEKSMAKELARRLMIRFRKIKQTGEFAALSSLILRRQGLKIAFADDPEIAQAIERNDAADAKLMGQQYDVV